MSTLNVDLIYAAGLVDGEGWIGAQRTDHFVRPHLAVNMTDEIGPSLLQSLFGGLIHLKKFPHKKWKDQFTWRIVGRQAVAAIAQLEPLLRIKKKQAQALLRSNWDRFNGLGIPDDERKLRLEIWQTLKELNRKGKL